MIKNTGLAQGLLNINNGWETTIIGVNWHEIPKQGVTCASISNPVKQQYWQQSRGSHPTRPYKVECSASSSDNDEFK
jgi:hypothetical protein